ncbi:MAG TPA: helix-turn-helix domain-containing protein [Rhizomicrobium sp.]
MTKGKTLPATRALLRTRPKAAERIRESARDLFYRQGIRAVGVDEIVNHAGVTKPSLYRSFPSKDELAADYLRHIGEEGLARFDAVVAAENPRAAFHAWLKDLQRKATRTDYRGCGATNAAVEYPERKHPARKVATDIKRDFRANLTALAAALGAHKPERLGDALLLLLEGVYASGQLFGPAGPARVLIEAADSLIEAHTA